MSSEKALVVKDLLDSEYAITEKQGRVISQELKKLWSGDESSVTVDFVGLKLVSKAFLCSIAETWYRVGQKSHTIIIRNMADEVKTLFRETVREKLR